MKTDAEKQAEITALERCKEYVPKKTFFGDDNHEKLDAQIRVIREGLDEDDCAKEFLHGGEIDEDGDPDERAYDLERAAVEASRWLFGKDDAPHKEWALFETRAKEKEKQETVAMKRKVSKNPALGAPYGKSKPVKGDPYKRVAKRMTPKRKK